MGKDHLRRNPVRISITERRGGGFSDMSCVTKAGGQWPCRLHNSSRLISKKKKKHNILFQTAFPQYLDSGEDEAFVSTLNMAGVMAERNHNRVPKRSQTYPPAPLEKKVKASFLQGSPSLNWNLTNKAYCVANKQHSSGICIHYVLFSPQINTRSPSISVGALYLTGCIHGPHIYFHLGCF